MRTLITGLTIILATLTLEAQPGTNNIDGSSKYDTGMIQAFKLWKEGKSWDAANMFERIANAAPDEWLPPFYVAQINVINSFSEKDKEKLTQQLKKAQDFINDAAAISKENPYITILQAQLYTAWIVFDGRQYGMEYSPKASALYDKAFQMDPENPAAIMARAEWNIGSAKYFGGSVEPYCEEIRRAIALSQTYESAGKYYPRFGIKRAQQVLAENCGD